MIGEKCASMVLAAADVARAAWLAAWLTNCAYCPRGDCWAVNW